jgi:hypothetical protein
MSPERNSESQILGRIEHPLQVAAEQKDDPPGSHSPRAHIE